MTACLQDNSNSEADCKALAGKLDDHCIGGTLKAQDFTDACKVDFDTKHIAAEVCERQAASAVTSCDEAYNVCAR